MQSFTIGKFENEYWFLSNFYPSPLVFNNILYPTVEHAYQAQKNKDKNKRLRNQWRRSISYITYTGLAKKAGSSIKLRKDWEGVKISIMTKLVHRKFSTIKCLGDALLATGNTTLVEGNTWGDVFWGTCKGKGANHLGQILMKVRDIIREERKQEEIFWRELEMNQNT